MLATVGLPARVGTSATKMIPGTSGTLETPRKERTPANVREARYIEERPATLGTPAIARASVRARTPVN